MRLTTTVPRVADGVPGPSWFVALALAGMLLVIGLIDRETEMAPVQHLYYLPIIIAGIRFTTRGGLLTALSAVLLYHWANPHLFSRGYQEPDVVQVVLFLAVGLVTARLARDNRRLLELAHTDELTGLHNLRSFEVLLSRMMSAASPEDSIALLVADLDNLKSLNDRYGHLTGAEGVRTVGHILASRLPPDAVACRYGGDEFAIAISNYHLPEVRCIANNLCESVRAIAPVLDGRRYDPATLTISVGAISMPRHELPDDVAEAGEYLFRQADRALYKAKAFGRNRACVA